MQKLSNLLSVFYPDSFLRCFTPHPGYLLIYFTRPIPFYLFHVLHAHKSKKRIYKIKIFELEPIVMLYITQVAYSMSNHQESRHIRLCILLAFGL